MNIAFGSTYTDPGATCTDNKDPTCAVVTTGTVNTSVSGSYTIPYTAIDTAGNITVATRTINVAAAPLAQTTSNNL